MAEVYFNIRRKVFSVVVGGRVVRHSSRVYMKDCRFKVGEKGRQRVIKEQKKNVHAKVHGDLVDGFSCDGGREATYNPYRDLTFVHRDDGSPVLRGERVLLEVVEGKARIIVWSDSRREKENERCQNPPSTSRSSVLLNV
jgi:hypothetical protein